MATGVVISPTFQPAMRSVIAITNDYPALITTGSLSVVGGIVTATPMVHDYHTGLVVQLRIPYGFGMPEIDNQFAPITVVNTTQFTIDIDTRTFRAFVIPALTYRLDPTSGWMLANYPYKSLCTSLAIVGIDVVTFPQVLTRSDTGYPAQNPLRNVLPIT